MTRLLIYEPSFRRLEAALRALGPRLEVLIVTADGAIATESGAPVLGKTPDVAWANADVLESHSVRDFMVALLKAPDLAWLQSGAAGFDHPVFAQLSAKGVRITTSHGQAVGMADYVLWGVLDVLQRGPERRAAQKAKEWSRFAFREIMGTQWLIVGFGAIGQGVAARARAFGARVTGVRRDQTPHPLADALAPPQSLVALAPEADVVVLCAPLNADTRHIADDRFFAALKPGSVLVNVGRGALIDEVALLRGLDRGAPAHAILDVFKVEPLPPKSRLWGHPGVTITAHHAGMTDGQRSRNDLLFLDNLGRWLDGRPLLNEVAASEIAAAP